MKAVTSPYEYFDAIIFNAKSENILYNDFRLNAEYYEEDSTIRISNNIEFFPLAEIASVVFPGIFKRYLVEDIKYGIKFLTTSDMMILEPESDKILSKDLTSNLSIYRVQEHTLLVSRSGSIGNTIYVDDRLKDFAITEDALRVKPFNEKYIGLLYFYFISAYGNGTITGKKSGAVIDHIYEDDLLKLPIPRFDEDLLNHFFATYLKVKSKREEADKIIKQARSLVLQYNNLPPLTLIKPKTLDEDGKVEIRMTGLDEFTKDYRLDAHFYNPMAKIIVENINTHSTNSDNLFNIADCSFRGSRSTRNYVDLENGIAFLSGKNIIQIRPEFKYISKSETANISDMLLTEGQILISRSGTLGRTILIYKNYEHSAASEHLIRVKPDPKIVDSGYLYAFLSSDYGYHQLLRYKHGAVIDEITEDQISQSLIPLPSKKQQKEIGDLVRHAYELRAEAIRLEDEALELITQTLTQE